MATRKQAEWETAASAGREIRVYDAPQAAWREAEPGDAGTLARYGIAPVEGPGEPEQTDVRVPDGDE